MLLLVVMASSGCQAWHLEGTRPESLLVTRKPSVVRVTRSDGSKIVLEDPVLRTDTLSGIASGQTADSEVAVPLADVRQVETPHFSAGRTIGLALGLAATVLATIAALFIISCSGGACST